MRIFLTSLMAFFLSAFAGGMIAQMLAVRTGATEEYILVFVATVIVVAVVVTLVSVRSRSFRRRASKRSTSRRVVLIVLHRPDACLGCYAWTLSAVAGASARRRATCRSSPG